MESSRASTGSSASAEESTSAGGRESAKAAGVADRIGEETATSPSGAGGAQTTEERTGDLERKLDESLTEFDGMLLKEQELLDERREASGGQSLGGGYGATGEEGAGGEASGSETATGPDSGGQGEEYSAQGGASGGSPDTPQGEPSESAPGESMGGDQGQTDRGRVPPDVGDGNDDDIVARQLREAAEKEDDPALREKLWDEYRAYKKGTKKD